MSLHQSGTTAIHAGVSARRKFKRANVNADNYSNGFQVGTGILPDEYRRALEAITTPVYVVKSYRTPIAWFTADTGWTMPDVKYSITTTGHQSAVRGAIR